MNEYANRVIALTDKIRKETGSSQIILIGHSMGGLIASMVAMQDSCQASLRSLPSDLPYEAHTWHEWASGETLEKCSEALHYLRSYIRNWGKKQRFGFITLEPKPTNW